MAKDLYEVLGVGKTADATELKSAYRKKARKFHPDVNKDAGAEDKFKEVQKAYEILSDSQKKANYDQFGVTDDMGAGQGGGGFGGFGGQGGGGFEDIFDAFFGGQGGSRQGGGGQGGKRRGEDLRFDLELNLVDVVDTHKEKIELYCMEGCSPCSGSGAKPGTSKKTCSQCGGAGQVQMVQRTMLGSFTQVAPCPQCHGEGSKIETPCGDCHGSGVTKKKKSIEVDIPAGVETGVKLRVSGEGNAGVGGGPSGDLYVYIAVRNDSRFKREGDHVYFETSVPMTQAVLGTKITVPTLKGKTELSIPEGTQPGTTFRLKGKGIPHLDRFGQGDQYVIVNVEIPKKLSSDDKKRIKEIAQSRKEG
ncbi:molecular chaperone DnaJ [bacterium]|jgi:molecular chaperone DnaJ|nr:molecular chaperone DnaJ [bacterium]